MSDDIQRFWAPALVSITEQPARNTLLEVTGGTISSIKNNYPRTKAFKDRSIEILDSCILMPAFINAAARVDTHIFRGMFAETDQKKNEESISKRRTRIGEAHHDAALLLGAYELKYSGYGTVCDFPYIAEEEQSSSALKSASIDNARKQKGFCEPFLLSEFLENSMLESQIEEIANSGQGVTVPLTQRANIGHSLFDLDTLLRAGIDVGLGTGSHIYGGTCDAFELMRQLIAIYRVNNDSNKSTLTLSTALSLTTKSAALSLGLTDRGELQIGSRADLLAVRLRETQNPLANLIYNGKSSAIIKMLVNGEDTGIEMSNILDHALNNAEDTRSLLAINPK